MDELQLAILALLQSKFAGVRKDGLQQLAAVISVQVANEEEANEVVGKLTADKVSKFVTDWRKTTDAEIAKANNGEYIPQAIAQGCDTFVTSDLRYNDFLDTQGLNLIDAGHFPTEDVVCQEIVRRLRETFPELEVTKSAVHGDAVKFYMR